MDDRTMVGMLGMLLVIAASRGTEQDITIARLMTSESFDYLAEKFGDNACAIFDQAEEEFRRMVDNN